MTAWIKMGVLGTLTPPTQKGLGRVIRLYRENGLDFFITSLCEGNHQPGSFHYIGQAFDFMQRKIPRKTIEDILGGDWDVIVFKVGDTDYVHAEYDPKRR